MKAVQKVMKQFDFLGYLSDARDRVDEALAYCLSQRVPQGSRAGQAMHYSLMAGGKRLRPILCLAGCEACGGNRSDALPAACAVEMIHTYSLIHDDLPAMDDDALRRGRPTCHTAFDEATAILAGDALLTLAFEVLADVGDDTPEAGVRQRMAIVGRLSAAAGIGGMIEGQMRDITAEGTVLGLDELTVLHRMKTGALIEASVWCGGVAGGAASDLLNVEGDPAKLGKAVGTDAKRQKSTYPALLGLTESKNLAEAQVEAALAAIDTLDRRSDPLRELARYVTERDR